METVDLKEIESSAYALRSESGMLDAVVGAGLLGCGLLASTGAYVVPSCCLLLAVLIRKFIVTPRVGRVRFAADRRARERSGVLLIALLVLMTIPLGLALFFADKPGTWLGTISNHMTLVLGLFVAGSMAAVAWAKSAGRFYFYAIMAVLDFTGAQFFSQPHTWALMAAGVPIFVVGVLLLVRFVRRNPVQKIEAA